LVIHKFVDELESLKSSIAPLMMAAAISKNWLGFHLNRFLSRHGTLLNETGTGRSYRIEPTYFTRVLRLDKKVKGARTAEDILPESMLVTLISRFDAFIGSVLRVVLTTRSELLKACEQALKLSELIDFCDLDSAKDYLIEKEIEAVLRKSHTDHFVWLEGKLQMQLRKDLPSWQRFIEITERRNLFVHSDGIVSHQYLANCREQHVELTTPTNVGDKLTVTPQYYREACNCLCELAVKLGHVLWRKLLPAESDDVDTSLNNICYELIVNENYNLAIELLHFALNTFKKPVISETARLTFLINCAQAYKWQGGTQRCLSLLEQEQWNAKGEIFQMCASILRNEFSGAISLMPSLSKSPSMRPDYYRDWPIFREIRKSRQFQEAYKDVYGNELLIIEESVRIDQDDVKEFILDLLKRAKMDTNSDT